MAPKIAVTGASGFVGRHVLAELARRGLSATVLLRPASPIPPWVRANGVVRLDIADAPTNAFELAGRPNVLIHLAWGGLPNYKSLHHFEQELPAQYIFLKAMVGAGLRHLVVSGTCFEYGMQSGPLHEDLPTAPGNPYGLAKDVLRRQLQCLQEEQPFDLTWARLFYLHGEGQAPNSLLPLLRRAVERGDTTFPMSGGEQLRDYLSATEMAQQFVTLALGGGGSDGNGCGIVNLCSGKPTSVRSLVEGWIAQHSWSITPELGHFPYPDHEPMAFWGDRRKLDRCLSTCSTPPSNPAR